jgi:hypothetical protein
MNTLQRPETARRIGTHQDTARDDEAPLLVVDDAAPVARATI